MTLNLKTSFAASQLELQHLFPGDSEMARRMRAFDWLQTPLGPVQRWPQNLRIAVNICLTSRLPMHVWWGPSLTLFYNDAYIPFLDPVKHPAAFGRPGRDACCEIWRTIGPTIEALLTTADAGASEHMPLLFERLIPKEEVYAAFSFSPMLGAAGKIDGILCACMENTDKLAGNRPLDMLRKLGIEAGQPRSLGAACEAAVNEEASNWLGNSNPPPLDALPARPPPHRSLHAIGSDTPKGTILVANDNADMRAYLRRLLESEYDVIAVADTQQALQTAAELKPDLVLTDVMMQNPDGCRLFDALRANRATAALPVILLTAHTDEEARLVDIQAEADDYLIKPFSARELLVRVRSKLALMRLRREAQQREASLGVELEAMNRLHDLSTRLLACHDLKSALEEVLDAAITMLGAAMGNVQLYNPKTKQSELVTQRGFCQDFLDHFGTPGMHEGSACSRAIAHGKRIIIEDVQADPAYAPHRQIAASAGYRAVQSTPLVSRGGQLLGILSTHFRQPHRPPEHALRMLDLYAHQAVDLIERMRAEEALRASEAKFRTLAEASPALIWQLDPHGNAVYLNPRFLELLGRAPEELIGTGWHVLLHPDSASADMEVIEQSLRQRTRWQHRGRIMCKNGGWHWIDSYSLPLFGADGEYTGHVGISIDITDRKLAEQALRDAHDRLEIMVLERTAELVKRNALLKSENAERMQAEAALRKSEDVLRQLAAYQESIKEDERKRIAREIHDELGQQLLALRIDASMLHARTGKTHPRLHDKVGAALQNIDVTIDSVRSIINNLRPAVLDLGLQPAIEWQVKEFERRSGIACYLVSDGRDIALPDNCATTLFRTLQESLTNIIRHAQATRVHIELYEDGSKLVIKISDNGIGIAANERRKKNSFGLLGMTERINLLGGDLAISSEPGRGTTVSVSVPK